ncbi:MAG TPA: hypothetical protein VIO14_10840 [Dehalococcoidia bacterium]
MSTAALGGRPASPPTSRLRALAPRLLLGLALAGGGLLRTVRLNDHYIYALDSTAHIDGLKQLLAGHGYIYSHYTTPGPELAVSPFLVLGGYSFWSAQAGIVTYNIALIALAYLVARLLVPRQPLIAGLFALAVAVNGSLVLTSRVVLWDTLQACFVLLYLAAVLATDRGRRRPLLVLASFPLAGFLMLMKIPNVLVVALGCLYLLVGPAGRLKYRRLALRDLAPFVAGALLLLAPAVAYLLRSPADRHKLLSAGGGTFAFTDVDRLVTNAAAFVQAFAGPLNAPATATFFPGDPGPAPWLWPLVLLQTAVGLWGFLLLLRQRAPEALLLAAVAVALAAFFVPYEGFQTRYVLPSLTVLLFFVTVGAVDLGHRLAAGSRVAVRVAAAAALLGLAAAAGVGLTDVGRALARWDTERSYAENSVIIWPEDVAAVEAALAAHPDAYVVTPVLSLLHVLGHEPRGLDLTAAPPPSPDGLAPVIDAELAAGRPVLYLAMWHDLDAGFRPYFDYVVTAYRPALLHRGANTYRHLVPDPAGFPTLLLYRITERSTAEPPNLLQNADFSAGTAGWRWNGATPEAIDGAALLAAPADEEAALWQAVPVDASAPGYELHARFATEGAGRAYLELAFLDAGGRVIQVVGQMRDVFRGPSVSGTTPPAGYVVTGQTPPGAVAVRAAVRLEGPGVVRVEGAVLAPFDFYEPDAFTVSPRR